MKRSREVFITVMIFLLLFTAMAYGITWSTAKRITDNTLDDYSPDIALDGSNAYVVWTKDVGGDREIYFKKSVDGGETWSALKRLTDNGESYSPIISVEGSNIYVVWSDNSSGRDLEIYFKKSIDGGDTWAIEQMLTNNAGDSIDPAIAVNGPNIYVVWTDQTPGDNEIYFRKSVDRGDTWLAEKRLTNNSGGSYRPEIAVDESNIYVVWYDNTTGEFEIYFKKSADGGDTWSNTKRITKTSGISASPDIGVDGSNIHVVWNDNTSGNNEIYFKKSVDGGDTWSISKRITKTSGISEVPAMAVDGSNIYVVWHDDTPGNYEIYFKESGDGGVTWTTSKRLTVTTGVSRNPAITVNGSNISIVWWDNTRGNGEIFFKKGLRP